MDRKGVDIFTYDLKNKFLKDGFYAKPMNTKIYLTFDEDDLDDDTTIIGNAVVMNVEESNDKIPVYSYNSDIFVKYLNGKKIITGYIALRKITLTKFLTLMRAKDSKIQLDAEIKNLNLKINEVLKAKANTKNENETIPYIELINSYNKEIREKKILLEQINNAKENNSFDSLYQLDVFKSEIFNTDNLLYYKDIYRNKNIKIKIIYEGNLMDQTLNIKDVLFVKKQTEINIQKNDIIEIYQFIGNPENGG